MTASIQNPTLPRPSVVPPDVQVQILGLGAAYPPTHISAQEYEDHVSFPASWSIRGLCDTFLTPEAQVTKLFNDLTPAFQKTLAINRKTGIEKRPMIMSPFYKNAEPPTITELSEHFRSAGVALAVEASLKALDDASLKPTDITHVVCTTVTDCSHPGYDVELVKKLGLENAGVERYLLSGIACAGGLAVTRTASNIILAAMATGREAKVLVVATEVISPLFNTELGRVLATGKLSIGVSLFSDGASAIVMSYGVNQQQALPFPSRLTNLPPPSDKPAYSIVGYTSWTIPDSTSHLRCDVLPNGWNLLLSPKVPELTATTLIPTFHNLVSTSGFPDLKPTDCDWAVHPGGAAILTACRDTMELDNEDHLRASWGVYKKRGNSSSGTVLSVLNVLRGGPGAVDILGDKAHTVGREWVIAVAFGPGVTVEMALLRRPRL